MCFFSAFPGFFPGFFYVFKTAFGHRYLNSIFLHRVHSLASQKLFFSSLWPLSNVGWVTRLGLKSLLEHGVFLVPVASQKLCQERIYHVVSDK